MEIIAIGITNLTDARYFAAMGVDWIGFDMRPESPLTTDHVVAFADWVEGPLFFLDVRGRHEQEIMAILDNFKADGLLLEEGIFSSHYTGKRIALRRNTNTFDNPADICIHSHEDWMHRTASDLVHDVEEEWVTVGGVVEYQALMSAARIAAGIVVSGSDEDKTGVKSYDNLDAIIELIRS